MSILADTINADSQSKNGGTVVVTSACGGTATWANANNTKVNDLAVATASNNFVGDQFGTRCLRMTNFSFSIPSNATINGIELHVTASDGTDSGTEGRVSLVNNSVEVGNFINNINTFIFTTIANMPTYTYGSSTDLWGLGSINPNNVNNITWGFDWGAINTVEQDTFQVQYMNMTVYYTNFTAPSSFCDRTKDCHLNCSQILSNIYYDAGGHSIIFENTTPTGHVYMNNVTITNWTMVRNTDNCFIDSQGAFK